MVRINFSKTISIGAFQRNKDEKESNVNSSNLPSNALHKFNSNTSRMVDNLEVQINTNALLTDSNTP